MIWFKLSLEEKSLDDSQELTEMVREVLFNEEWTLAHGYKDCKEVLYTGSHEINEQSITLEDNVWESYEEWEVDLLAEGQEEEIICLPNHELIVITSVEDKRYIQVKGEDLPAFYVTTPC
mgnify:CR=1 FL=1|tara:strand:+ start:153 stop:512 length:360 start_codon:yes stop_codon:yes gene_type:complete